MFPSSPRDKAQAKSLLESNRGTLSEEFILESGWASARGSSMNWSFYGLLDCCLGYVNLDGCSFADDDGKINCLSLLEFAKYLIWEACV